MDETDILVQNTNDENNDNDLQKSPQGLNGYQTSLLYNILIQNSISVAGEGIIIVYYTVYMYDKYGYSVISSSAQLTALLLTASFGMLGITILNNYKIERKRNPTSWLGYLHNEIQYDFFNIYCLCGGFSLVVCIILTGVAFPMSNGVLYWFYNCIFGLVYGILVSSQEFIFLELQPKEQSGKIRGQQLVIRTIIRAFEILIIGIMWADNYEYFWYWQTIFFAVILVLLVWMIITESFEFSFKNP